MAFKNKVIVNPKTHTETRFLQTRSDTSGELLEMEMTYPPHSIEPAAHYHPYQCEDFTVLSGELTVRICGQLKILKKGDQLHVPKNKIHSMWNNSDQRTVVNWKVEPALNSEYFFETLYGLAQDGKTNEKGIPNILQVAITALHFRNIFRLAKIPYFIQLMVFALLLPFAFVSGCKPVYRRYID